MASSPHTIRLNDVALFQDLSEGELQALSSFLQENSFEKDEIIAFEGEECRRIFIVQSGRIKIFRCAGSGREQILEVLGPGDSCACNPGVQVWQCSATSQALSPCKVWFLPRQHYNNLINSNSKLMKKLTHIFATRLCRFSSLIEDVSLTDSRHRLVRFLLNMFGAQKAVPGKPVSISFTREEIAQRLGLVRETVTRHLQNLRRKKLIDIKAQQILLLDRQGLEKLLD